jgi:ABC-type glycerol-3-phosphate transport system permease component
MSEAELVAPAPPAEARRPATPRRRVPVGTRVVVYLGLAVIACAVLGPMLYLVMTSLKSGESLFSTRDGFFPSSLDLTNYRTLLEDTGFLRWTFNSLLVASAVTALKLVFDAAAAYAFVALDFTGRSVIFGALLASLMIPLFATLIPLFFIVRDLGLLNSYWALILPPLANPIGIIMLRGFMGGLPRDLASAARLDGCPEWRILLTVIAPLVRPGLVVVGIYTFMTQYTSFLWPLVAITDTSGDDKRVLTTGISGLTALYAVDWGLVAAAGVLALLPITVVFVLFQRHFIAGSLAGAFKG